jgi:hypothetical protein
MPFEICRGISKKAAIAFAAAVIFASYVPGAFAQQVAVSQIAGTVSDPTGKAVAGAQVKMIETDKQVAHISVTDASGRYEISSLPVGDYLLEVSSPGFKTYVQKGIILQVASNPTQNVKLDIGSVSESIEVTGDASMVETKDNAIGQVIQAQSIVDLPLNGRNPTQLLMLQGAGTTTLPQGQDLTGSKNMLGSNASGTFSVAGSQANGVNFLLDGGDNNDAFSNVNLPIPFPDAIQEFNVQTNGLPAQYGLHPGGVVNIVTKSGANAIHGDAFEFLRNGDLNARQEGTLARDTLKRSQFGGTVGGRIIKDKLFFFGGFQGTRIRSDPANNTAYVPTAAVLKGDFSVVDGGKATGGCLATARTLKNAAGVPYNNNQIPVSTFDPAGYKLLSSYIPVASDPCGKVLFGYLANNPDNQWIGRIDYNISPKQAIFGRYYIYDYTGEVLFDGKNALTTGTFGNQQRSQTMTFGDTYTFTATLLNSFHATFDRRRDNRGDAANFFSPKDLGVNMYVAVPNYTQLTVSGYSGGGFAIGCGTCAPGFFDVNTYQVADDITWVKGKHQIGFGFDLRKDQFNSVNNQQDNGQFTFNGSTTGDGMADLLVGRFSGLTAGNALSNYLRQTVFAAYVQDTFHATNHMTVNLGLRWEPSVPSYDKQARGDQFSWALFNQNVHSTQYPSAPAGLIFANDSQNANGKYLTDSHWMTFSPRVGLVFDPKGDGSQTIRAAFSMMHETTELYYPERETTNPPYASSQTLSSGQFSDPFASYVSPGGIKGDPYPGAALFPVGGTYISIPPHLSPTYVMQWNLSYQRQFGKDWLMSATYLGNATRHIWASTDINYAVYTGSPTTSTTANTAQRRLTYLANPSQGQYYGDIQQTDDGATAEYHGLLLKAEHRMATHFQLLTTFNWSHCVSDWDFGGELGNVLYQNPLNRHGERGPCSFDHRLQFNTSLVATSGGFGNTATKLITKNWQVSPIISLLSGAPIMITDGGVDNSRSGQLQDRPNVVLPNAVIPAQRTVLEWFNPAAFAVQPIGTFGNLGRFAVYGPGTIQFDLSVSRRFDIKERFKLEVRSDLFNIMNHGNWNNPTTSITSGTFGQVTAFSSPRIIQMAMKLYF